MPEYDDIRSTSTEYEMVSDSIAAGGYLKDASEGFVETIEAADYEQMVIKTGSLSLHVDDVRSSAEQIKALTDSWEGYVDDFNVSRYEGYYSASMTVRVPSEKFETSIDELKEMAVYVSNEYTNTDDVTEYYMDLEARIRNKEAVEVQYLELLNKATEVDTMVTIISALENVRYEIESLKGELKGYDNRIQYSSLTLNLSEDASPSGAAETWRPVSTIKEAFSDWLQFLQGLLDDVIYVLIYGWPLVVMYFGYRIYKRRGR